MFAGVNWTAKMRKEVVNRCSSFKAGLKLVSVATILGCVVGQMLNL